MGRSEKEVRKKKVLQRDLFMKVREGQCWCHVF